MSFFISMFHLFSPIACLCCISFLHIDIQCSMVSICLSQYIHIFHTVVVLLNWKYLLGLRLLGSMSSFPSSHVLLMGFVLRHPFKMLFLTERLVLQVVRPLDQFISAWEIGRSESEKVESGRGSKESKLPKLAVKSKGNPWKSGYYFREM